MEQTKKQSKVEIADAQSRLNRFWRFAGVFSASLFALVISLTILQCSVGRTGSSGSISTSLTSAANHAFDPADAR